jgi:hypothetical protein
MRIKSKVWGYFIGNTDGSHVLNGLHQIVFLVTGNIKDFCDLGGSPMTATTGPTSICIVGLIRVRVFGIDTTSILDVFVGLARQSTIASMIVVRRGTIQQLLFRQTGPCRTILPMSKTGVGLQATSGGKGPTRTTILLILDGSDNPFGPPIDCRGWSLGGVVEESWVKWKEKRTNNKGKSGTFRVE